MLLKKRKGISSSIKLICLQLTMDDYGIIGCSGRIVNAEFLPIKIIYPTILPQTPWVTKLIIKLDHEDGHHSTGASHKLVVFISKALDHISKRNCQTG